MFLGRRRQFEPEAAAFSDLGFQADASAHPLHSAANEGQPDAGARIAFMGMQPLEQTENLFMILRRDANSIVGNPDTHHSILFLGPDFEVRNGIRAHEFQTIGNQVVQDLPQGRRMSPDHCQWPAKIDMSFSFLHFRID